MNGEDDALVPVWQVARILQLPSTQALWRMLHAGVMQVVWDKGRHAVPRAALTAYLEDALSAIPEERAADEKPLDESPFSYCRAAAHVRRKITDGTLQPGDRVVAKQLAEECNLGLDSARRGLAMLADQGELRHYPGTGWVVSSREQ